MSVSTYLRSAAAKLKRALALAARSHSSQSVPSSTTALNFSPSFSSSLFVSSASSPHKHRHHYHNRIPHHLHTFPLQLSSSHHTSLILSSLFRQHHELLQRSFSGYSRFSPRYTPPSASSSSTSSSSSLTELEQVATSYPNDAFVQQQLYEKLLHSDPQLLVSRFESDRFASNSYCYSLYLSAKSQLAFQHAQPQVQPQLFTPHSSSSSSSSTFPSSSSSSSNPSGVVQVQLVNDVFQHRDGNPVSSTSNMWQRVRRAGGLALMVVLGYYLYKFTLSSSSSSSSSSFPTSSLFGRDNAAIKEYKANSSIPSVTFADVKGCDEAKSELEEVVAFLRSPEQFTRLGGKMPKGILLLGPPGTGKTLLAKAIAGEAGVPFFFASGSEFEEMFVGVGARRIRDLFAAAKKKSPAIIFIDEIDSVGSKRQSKDIQAARMSLNELLVQLDGFSSSTGIIVIGATNFPKLLDPALVRPGRFDRHVTVNLPDIRGRLEILQLYAAKITMHPSVDLSLIARGTPGMTGADLSNLVNTAALRAAQVKEDAVHQRHLEWAKDRIIMGAERTSHVQSEKEKKLTAYHEGGHALVALSVTGAMPIHKATILPRGQTLGVVSLLPEDDQESHTRLQLIASMTVCMGGRAAEELIFGSDSVTTGASSDLDKATQIAKTMVMKYGMAEDTVGLISFSTQEDLSSMSGEVKRNVDTEVRKLLDSAYSNAKKILTDRNKDLHTLASALLAYETLDREEILGILNGSQPTPPRFNQNKDNKSKTSPTAPSSPSNASGKPSGSLPLPLPHISSASSSASASSPSPTSQTSAVPTGIKH